MFRQSLTRFVSHTNKRAWDNCSAIQHSVVRGVRTTSAARAAFNVQDEEDFTDRVLKSTTPVVVDFHAQWCGPCKLLGPRLETIIGGKGEKVHLAKVDIDDVSDLALDYGPDGEQIVPLLNFLSKHPFQVSAVPSVLAVKDGKIVDKFVGLQEESRIEAFVNRLIGE